MTVADEFDAQKDALTDEKASGLSCTCSVTNASENEESEKEKKNAFLGFTGCYNHGIDAKGRMIIPASFREALGEKFVTGLTLDFNAIALYPVDEWLKQQNMLEELLKKDIRVQLLIDRICKYSYTDTETDAQGRLLLPGKLRSMILGDAREIEVSGAKTYIRVVSAQSALDEEEEFKKEIPNVLDFIARVQQT